MLDKRKAIATDKRGLRWAIYFPPNGFEAHASDDVVIRTGNVPGWWHYVRISIHRNNNENRNTFFPHQERCGLSLNGTRVSSIHRRKIRKFAECEKRGRRGRSLVNRSWYIRWRDDKQGIRMNKGCEGCELQFKLDEKRVNSQRRKLRNRTFEFQCKGSNPLQVINKKQVISGLLLEFFCVFENKWNWDLILIN